MAQNNSTARQSFYEVVFKGKPKVVRAFVTGLTMGNGTDATVFFSFTDGVHHEGKAERLSELIHIRATDCHVIVDSGTNALFKKLSKRILGETGLEIVSQVRIKSASVKFSFQAFAPRYNDEIVALVKSLPKGLKIEGFKHDVQLDPKAKGIEAYSPAHHYEANGEATVSGRVDLVIDLKKRFGDFPLIKSEDVQLQLA
jgi:hypothetical protein